MTTSEQTPNHDTINMNQTQAVWAAQHRIREAERIAYLRAHCVRMPVITLKVLDMAGLAQNGWPSQPPFEQLDVWGERIEAERIAIRESVRDGQEHYGSEYITDMVVGPPTREQTEALYAYKAHCLGQEALRLDGLSALADPEHL